MGKKDKMKNKWTKLDKNEKHMDKNCQKCKSVHNWTKMDKNERWTVKKIGQNWTNWTKMKGGRN